MTTSFSTLRSPVMSIRTQPAEEDSLRAEIEAATRTQHEIFPRHSWHSALTKKDNYSSSKQTRNSAHRNTSSLQMDPTPTSEDDGSMFAEYVSMPPGAAKDALSFLRPSPSTARPWRQLTKRITRREPPLMTAQPDGTSKDVERAGKRHNKPSQKLRRSRNDAVAADEDRAAQHAQFDAWLEARSSEHNNLANHSSLPVQKSKRTMRKSVYGSLSNTKSFLKEASKSPLEKLRSYHGSSSTPHVDSFENKDQLREYLNQIPSASPLSPLDAPRQVLSVPEGIEPVELSAGPIPAELDGTNAEVAINQHTSVSRVSSPSIPDLPPYIDDKKFRADIAKEQRSQEMQSGNKPSQELHDSHETSYVCNSCEKSISSCDVYDFCSVCDTNDRVLCTECAKRGPCCQHELEGLLRACALGQVTPDQPIHLADVREAGPDSTQPQRIASHGAMRRRDVGLPNRVSTSLQSIPEHNPGNAQQDFLKEMNNLQREHDLVHRERELALRAREIELRDQHITLREREAIVQHRSDLLLQKLESVVAATNIPVHPFIGAQFQASYSPDRQGDPRENYDAPRRSPSSHDGHSVHAENSDGTRASAHDILRHDASVKSYAAQKRKKEGAANSGSTTSSTPTAASSSDHAHKPLSRGNSERDTSQDEDEDEGDRRRPKKNKQDTPPSNGPHVLFACPYAKHNPQRFSSRNVAEKNYRGCGTHYLPDVSRLKQHLKRVHWQPEIYCPRCYEEFADPGKLMEHARARVACNTKACPFPEKMDKAMQEKIHTKRPRVPPDTVWYDIFKVLFPGSPLPESPYMEAKEQIVTPSSATPQTSARTDAVQMLSNIFNNKLNQHEAMQNNSLRSIIQNTLTESFAELLDSFSISPCASPGAGPSILISPVSRSSSDGAHVPGSPFASPSRSPKKDSSATSIDVVHHTQQVPQLQHPRPPRPRLHTALQVPQDHRRSPVGHGRMDSTGSGSPADFIFDINILPHIQDDTGYDDECRSFEQGDDLRAMGITNEPALPACRTKSVMSIDSGYGSGRSHHPMQQSVPMKHAPSQQQTSNGFDHMVTTEPMNAKPQMTFPQSQYTPLVGPNLFAHPMSNSDDYHGGNFMSYSNFLDPTMSQDITGSDDLLFPGHSNPWNYP